MPTTNVRKLLLFEHPNASFITLATLLAIISFPLTPSAIPIIINLAVLLLYSRIFLPRAGTFKNVSLLLTGLTVGGAIPKLAASLSALSSSGVSILVLLAGSVITSIIAVCAVLLDAKICMHFKSPWTQVTLFPALWASLWSGVAYVSPIGRLSTWSPTYGTEAYSWLVPLLGPAAIDWIVAACAVALSQAVAAWFMSADGLDEVEPLVDNLERNGTAKKASQTHISIYLAGILAALSIPSLFTPKLPLPVISQHTTPLTVGCVLPPYTRYKHHSLTLDDYIEESKKLTSLARVLLWPESAVVFHNASERDAAFTRVQHNVTGSLVGVSFEETFPDPNDETGWRGARRNGIAFISKDSKDPHLVYYKRKLVPIAESFSLTHSEAPPEIYTLELPHPKDVKKDDWAPFPNYTRPIPITTSICLDFTAPDLFRDLPSRPALILAPARTWNLDIGVAMWNQAKHRANELGTTVLWCDGGEGGVSGVAGRGYEDPQQVGSGSWSRTIGLDYPHRETRTIYATFGSYTLVLLWLIALGASPSSHNIHFLPGGTAIKKISQTGAFIMARVRKPRDGRISLPDEQGPLVDLEN